MLYFIRHSERFDAVIGKSEWFKTDRGKQNVLDPPLSSNGYDIAKTKIKSLLESHDGIIEYIYTSPADRCIETACIFQTFIKEKYNMIVPLRIEYGLIYTSSGCDENWFTSKDQKRITYVDDNFVISDPLTIGVDEYMTTKHIIRRYSEYTFDTAYESVISVNETNNECTFGKSIENRLKIAKYFAHQHTKYLNLIVTHGEMLTILECYGNKIWDYVGNRSFFGGDDGYCSCVKFESNSRTLKYAGRIR